MPEESPHQKPLRPASTLRVAPEIHRETITPIIRELLIITGFLGMIALGTLLPGAHYTIPGTTIAISDTIIGIGTLGIVVSLLYVAPDVQTLTVELLKGEQEIVSNIGYIAKAGVMFAAVLVGHLGFAPVLKGDVLPAWAYDLTFLVLALMLLGIMAYHYYRILTPMTSRVTTAVLDPNESTNDQPESQDPSQ